MTSETAVTILRIALIVVAALIVLHHYIPGPCVCKDCVTHTREREEKERKHQEIKHNVDHKGYGYQSGTPDYMNCRDRDCRRNKRGGDE